MDASDHPKTMSVVLADDHPLFGRGLAHTLQNDSRLEVRAAADGGKAALEAVMHERPDVVVLDMRMPDLDGLGVFDALRERGDRTPVVFLSAFGDGPTVHRALASGAAGFVAKDAPAEEICNAVVMAARGGRPRVSRTLVADAVEQIGRDCDRPLSSRELEIVRAIADGRSHDQIGAALSLSVTTVKTYLHRAYEKLEVSNAAAAVDKAWRLGLLP